LRWWRFAANATDPHPVLTFAVHLDGVEPRGHVRACVAGAGDLVQQLSGHGADGDRSPGPWVLGDDARAVGVHLGDREARMPQVRHLRAVLEERVVATGGLRA